MNGKKFLKDKEFPSNERELELLLEEFAWKFFIETDLRFLLLKHPARQDVETACLHFLGDEVQLWWYEKNKC